MSHPESYDGAAAVTPSDVAENVFEAFVVTLAGNVSVVDARGNTVTIPCLAGAIVRLRVTMIRATDTTADGIVGFF